MKEAMALCRQALQAHRAGQFFEAKQGYEAAIALDPDCADAHHLLGAVLSDLGEDEAALQAYDRALALKHQAVFWANRAESCRRLQRLDEAAANLREAIILDPKSSFFVAQAAIYRLLGDLDRASAALQGAAAFHPRDPAIAHQQGLVQIARAVQALKKAQAFAETHPWATVEPGISKLLEVLPFKRPCELQKALEHRCATQSETSKQLEVEASKTPSAPENPGASCETFDEDAPCAAILPFPAPSLSDVFEDPNASCEASASISQEWLSPEALASTETDGFEFSPEALGHLSLAAAAFQIELERSPEDPAAFAARSAVLGALGRTEEAHEAAWRALCLRGPELRRAVNMPGCATAHQAPHVLALHALGHGRFHLHPDDGQVILPKDTNLHKLLPPEFAVTELFVDALANPLTLPRNLVIWNAVGEPKDADRVAQFLKPLPKLPIINDPARVALTDRAENAKRLACIEGVRFPKTHRILARNGVDLYESLRALAFEPPFLLRRPGTQAGRSLQRIDDFAQILCAPPETFAGAFLAIEYIDFADETGLYAKFRVFFVDGELCPSLCSFDRQWNIHAASRTHIMYERRDLQAREALFVREPSAILPARVIDGLRAVARLENLDVCGIDFALPPPGQQDAVIFEVNAAMAQNPSRLKAFPDLAPAFEKLTAALARMVYARLG